MQRGTAIGRLSLLQWSHADFRATLASALTDALPQPVGVSDVGVASAVDLFDDPLAGVSVTIRDGEHMAPLAEQSDGVRALSVLALIGLSHQHAQIVGIDEPETHLHVTAQRAVGAIIRCSPGQRVIATHSSAIVSRMNPLDIAAFGADRRVRQLPPGTQFADLEVMTRHWGDRMIEPLTAKRIVLVEGPSDRIVLVRAAELLGQNFDRAGVAVFELDGANLFSTANNLFGRPGFDLPVYGLVDSSHARVWAAELGVAYAALETAGIVESAPDLEAESVDALRVERVVGVLCRAGVYSEQGILNACCVATIQHLNADLVTRLCRKHKTQAAIAISQVMTAAEVTAIGSIYGLLTLICS